MSSNAMALLASYPRSGNTWLRSFILALSLGPEAFRASYAELDGYVPSDTSPELYTGAGIDLEALDAATILSRRDEMLRFLYETMPNLVLKTHTMLATVRGTPALAPHSSGPWSTPSATRSTSRPPLHAFSAPPPTMPFRP